MKKNLLFIIALLSGGTFFADSIYLTNRTNLPAYFLMITDRNPQGPFCVQPGEKVYVDALTYKWIQAHVQDGEGAERIEYPCYVTQDVKRDLANPWHYDHIVAIEPCKPYCEGLKFQIKKIHQTRTRPKRAQEICSEMSTVSPEKKNLLRRLVADYKETWQLHRKRKAGKASVQELKKLEERMSRLKKRAKIAGVAAAFTAAVIASQEFLGVFARREKEGEPVKSWRRSPIYEPPTER